MTAQFEFAEKSGLSQVISCDKMSKSAMEAITSTKKKHRSGSLE